MSSVSAQSTIFVATPVGNAVATYKNALKTHFTEVMGGCSIVTLTNNAMADSIAQIMTIDRTNRKVSSNFSTQLYSSGIDYICYSIIDERNGRLNIETMLVNCSTGNVERILSRSISRDMEEIRMLTQIFTKQLLF